MGLNCANLLNNFIFFTVLFPMQIYRIFLDINF